MIDRMQRIIALTASLLLLAAAPAGSTRAAGAAEQTASALKDLRISAAELMPARSASIKPASAHAVPRLAGEYTAPANENRETERRGISGWTVHVDNDLFAFTNEDRDYTAGVSVTLGGADDNVLSGALGWLDSRIPLAPSRGDDEESTRFSEIGDARTKHSLEIGLVLFTPNDLEASGPLRDDRPYANLAYVASSRLSHEPGSSVARQSSLTLGMLGLPFAEGLHRAVHDAVGSPEPMGYEHQISDGGEPTFRYAVSKYRLLHESSYGGRPFSLRFGTTASIGYLTEANAELEFRWGNMHVPWWVSLPSASDYAGHPPMKFADEAGSSGMRLLASGGLTARVRAYNSFLQGQFRDSDVTYPSSRLNRLLLEAWIGLTTVFPNDLRVSYTVRRQTEELEDGRGARSFTWASIGVAKQF
ncbi:MAG: lipid A deacylase LpxR family protein [Gammaproteobacteria bacterium]|nr:lipid A deacylase LpxR family protein [Gammaproteobacteria bacterium]